jgi:hypothetical protein
MDVVDLHERRDKILVFLLFNVSDLPICWCDDPLSDGTLWVTEENKEKNKDTQKRDKTDKEPKRKPAEH